MTRKWNLVAWIIIIVVFLSACSHKSSGDDVTEQKKSDITGVEGPTQEDRTEHIDHQEIVVEEDRKQLDNESAESAQEDAADETMAEVDRIKMSEQDRMDHFYYEELSEDIIDRINGKSYKENCDIPYEELRYVRVLYWGFDDITHNGELIVNKIIAEDITQIFKELYDQKYPIEQMVLVDEYDADDNTSMEADNTSSFNYRKVDGSEHLSLHSYGLAIDINPRYNPYVRTVDGMTIVTPYNGTEYADRSIDCSYYIDTEDVCYQAFIKHGFTWGGAWKNSKDYQHFQKTVET